LNRSVICETKNPDDNEFLLGKILDDDNNDKILENIDASFEFENKTLYNAKKSFVSLNENEGGKIGNKHKNLFNEIKRSIDMFINDFTYYFNDNVVKDYSKTINKLNKDRYQRHFEIQKTYFGQIKEMEFLMSGNLYC